MILIHETMTDNPTILCLGGGYGFLYSHWYKRK